MKDIELTRTILSTHLAVDGLDFSLVFSWFPVFQSGHVIRFARENKKINTLKTSLMKEVRLMICIGKYEIKNRVHNAT